MSDARDGLVNSSNKASSVSPSLDPDLVKRAKVKEDCNVEWMESTPLKPCSGNLERFFSRGSADAKKPGDENQDPIPESDEMERTPVQVSSAVRTSFDSENKKTKEHKSKTPSTKKSSKRERSLFLETLDDESKAARIAEFQQEIASLYKYFEESFGIGGSGKPDDQSELGSSSTKHAIVAALLEESRLPYSKIVQEIFNKLKSKVELPSGGDSSIQSIESTVLLIGQRPCYGVSKDNMDNQLEDESESCLWCWEVNDLKLLPKSQREFITIRRKCRKKIKERMSALSDMISALSTERGGGINLSKAEEKLTKTDDEMSIKYMVAESVQKIQAQIMAKEAKAKEREALKEKERNERQSEMEQKRLEREMRKEKLLQEKEQARAMKEAIMQEKERKKQQEEAQKEQKRREKEEAEKKKKVALEKQASLMGRFLKSKKDVPKDHNVLSNPDEANCSQRNTQVCNELMTSMDQILHQSTQKRTDELMRLHLGSWKNCYEKVKRFLGWGIRRKPKVTLFSELRLQKSANEETAKVETQVCRKRLKRASSDPDDIESPSKDLLHDLEDVLRNTLSENNEDSSNQRDRNLIQKRMKLLQFDKSNRPAYYGTFSKRSDAVKPRCPFAKDSSLDYEVDSDEEWEEEDPGESLSECHDDDEEEKLENEKLKAEDDEDSDGFLVPDGYLSEDEGLGMDNTDSDGDQLEKVPSYGISNNSGKNHCPETESEWHSFERHQKVLDKAIAHALRSNHVFVVANLPKDRVQREKDQPLGSTEQNARVKLEQMCLQALCIQICFPMILIEVPHVGLTESYMLEDEEPPLKRQRKNNANFQESDLAELVSLIQSSPQGINKIVETSIQKFPRSSKKQIKEKIREIADFTDNRWQVKKKVTESMGATLKSGDEHK